MWNYQPFLSTVQQKAKCSGPNLSIFMVVSLVLRAQKRLVDVYWKFKKRGFERYCPRRLLKPDTSVVRKATSLLGT